MPFSSIFARTFKIPAMASTTDEDASARRKKTRTSPMATSRTDESITRPPRWVANLQRAEPISGLCLRQSKASDVERIVHRRQRDVAW